VFVTSGVVRCEPTVSEWTVVRAATAWSDERHSGDLVGALWAWASVRY